MTSQAETEGAGSVLLVAKRRCLAGNGCYCSRGIWRKVTCILARILPEILACGPGMFTEGQESRCLSCVLLDGTVAELPEGGL